MLKKDAIPPMRENISYSPHVVILGAGASMAAFPKGDKNSKTLPLMNSLVETLKLHEILPTKYLGLVGNFENLYNIISEEMPGSGLKSIIEDKVYQYFYDLEISDTPTLYDYLILSLREKDIIATFNWDPLLLKCLRRHEKIKNLPKVVFLHGNVAVGVCKNCNLLGYSYNEICHRCYRKFTPMKLLYPIKKKDYSSEASIKGEWEQIRWYLEHGFYTTIFGYGAPDSDEDAKNLLLEAVKTNLSKVFCELEVIDVKSRSEVESKWYNFLYKNHYRIIDTFQKSYLWYHPRRSCDAFASAYLMNTPWPDNPFPSFNSITEMHDWIGPLIEDEEKVELKKSDRFTYKAK